MEQPKGQKSWLQPKSHKSSLRGLKRIREASIIVRPDPGVRFQVLKLRAIHRSFEEIPGLRLNSKG
jgi:hypothetical protein